MKRYMGVIPDPSRRQFTDNVLDFLLDGKEVDRRALDVGLQILGNFHSQSHGVGKSVSLPG